LIGEIEYGSCRKGNEMQKVTEEKRLERGDDDCWMLDAIAA
jgi:hypothetical protein